MVGWIALLATSRSMFKPSLDLIVRMPGHVRRLHQSSVYGVVRPSNTVEVLCRPPRKVYLWRRQCKWTRGRCLCLWSEEISASSPRSNGCWPRGHRLRSRSYKTGDASENCRVDTGNVAGRASVEQATASRGAALSALGSGTFAQEERRLNLKTPTDSRARSPQMNPAGGPWRPVLRSI